MRPGPLIRRAFGPFEHSVAGGWRRIFVNLDEFANLISKWVPDADEILEVGCGEGAMTERLVRKYPQARITAIDITDRIGRLYRGPASNVTFARQTVENVSRTNPGSFDLLVLSDVLHHVPLDRRLSLLEGIDGAISAKGSFVCKEWLRSATPVHLLAHAADRYLTGDDVRYLTAEGMLSLLRQVFTSSSIRQVDTVPPWRNNLTVLIQP